jgi:hypothetical protein
VPALIAKIVGARNSVVTNRRRSGDAAVDRVTSLLAIAEQSVIAQFGIRRMHALVQIFVAGIQRAGDTVAAIDRRAGDAAVNDIAQFDAVAEDAVIA